VLNTFSPPDSVKVSSKRSIVAEKRCWGDPRGYALLGRRTLHCVREGEAASREKEKASVGRGKAELFPLQGGLGRLNLKWSLQPFLKTFASWIWKCSRS